MCLLPPLRTPRPSAFAAPAARPADPAWLLPRCHAVGAIPPPTLPTEAEAAEWWRQCRLISPTLWRAWEKAGRSQWVVRGMPVTAVPAHEDWKDVPVGTYPDGSTFTFSDLPALSVPLAFRLDWFDRSGSAAPVVHEWWHEALEVLFKGLDRSPGWLRVWQLCDWPGEYERRSPTEAQCEGMAMHLSKRGRLDPRAVPFFDTLLSQLNWTPWAEGYLP